MSRRRPFLRGLLRRPAKVSSARRCTRTPTTVCVRIDATPRAQGGGKAARRQQVYCTKLREIVCVPSFATRL